MGTIYIFSLGPEGLFGPSWPMSLISKGLLCLVEWYILMFGKLILHKLSQNLCAPHGEFFLLKVLRLHNIKLNSSYPIISFYDSFTIQ